MNKNLFAGAFVFGALAVVWVAFSFLGSNYLALVMTMIIGAVYAFGVQELRQFRHDTSSLDSALGSIPESLATLSEWLNRVPMSLQNPVRLRIEGERIGLPGPALTPYLVGLLVMLGMLGTFIGMVVTFNGAVFALDGTTDLKAMRSALGAPIRGLGLAFGTSVAGVAASAMLGLMSALSRRERMQVAQRLDTRIGIDLHRFSLAYQRQETLKAIQTQGQALPVVVDKLQTMMQQMDQLSQQLNQRLLTNQESFHSEVKAIYGDLATSVDKSLKESLTQSAQLAGESIKPVLETAMTGIAQDADRMHQQMVTTTQHQLERLTDGLRDSVTSVAETFEHRSAALLTTIGEAYTAQQAVQTAADQQRMDAWTGSLESMAKALNREWQDSGAQTLARQQQILTTLSDTAGAITEQAKTTTSTTLAEITRLMSSSEEMVRSRITAEADWIARHNERMDQLAQLLRSELGALRDQEALRSQAAVERLGELQTALATHLTTLGTALEEPITRLIHTASEAPRAAAEVIAQLRQEISHSVARDNELLDERSRIMETLSTLLDAINHAAAEQRAVIDSLVTSSAIALQQAGTTFAEQMGTESAKLATVAAHVTSSAVDVSSLGEAFSLAVQSFSTANEHLISNLQRIEAAMDKSTLRSDEQLAYYVAQAREIIDLSVMSQKDIVDELRQLPGRSVANSIALAGEVR